MMIDLPPTLILPDHWVAKRPAIIRPEVDPQRHFPVLFTKAERRVAQTKLIGRLPALLPGMVPITAGSEPTLTYLGAGRLAGSATTFNFGNFVAPGPGLMIVGFWGAASTTRTLSSLSIGGTNGTIVAQYDSTLWQPHGFVTRAVTAAGPSNVTATYSGAIAFSSHVGVWHLAGHLSSTHRDIQNTGWLAGQTSRSVTLGTPESGVTCYIVVHTIASDTLWSNAIERAELATTTDLGAARWTVADAVGLSASGITATASWTGSAEAGITGISFR